MKELPDGFETSALIEPLALGWGFNVETLEYAPVGFGSYHWVATDAAGRRVFVTVDDLDRKPALGRTRGAAFDGLTRAFASAVALSAAGLAFVCAPEPTREGDPLRRIGDRHTVAVFPFVEGEAGRQFEYDAAEVRAAVVTMLARLHEATSAVESVARRIDLQLPGRSVLESALRRDQRRVDRRTVLGTREGSACEPRHGRRRAARAVRPSSERGGRAWTAVGRYPWRARIR